MRRAQLVKSLVYVLGAAAGWGCGSGERNQDLVLPAAPAQVVAGAPSAAPVSPPQVADPLVGASGQPMTGAVPEPAVPAAPPPAAMMDPVAPAAAPAAPTGPIPSISFAVSDLEKSVAFYTGPMGMRRLGEVTYADRTEVMLAAHTGPVVFGLMKYTDGIERNVTNVPAKLIFGVSNTAEAAQRITDAGYSFQIAGIIANDPDGYGAELLEQPNTDRSVVAVGIFVSEYMNSIDFYVGALGMNAAQDTGLGAFMEKLMLGGGLAHGILIMHYDDGVVRNYKDNPVKLSFAVPNAATSLMRIESAGQRVVAQPAPEPARANALVALAKDPDGYLLEFVQR